MIPSGEWVGDLAEKIASRAWFENGLEGSFAGLQDFQGAPPLGMAGEFQHDRVARRT
jgi:hypothetical protein